jgi:hypothetical protein
MKQTKKAAMPTAWGEGPTDIFAVGALYAKILCGAEDNGDGCRV